MDGVFRNVMDKGSRRWLPSLFLFSEECLVTNITINL